MTPHLGHRWLRALWLPPPIRSHRPPPRPVAYNCRPTVAQSCSRSPSRGSCQATGSHAHVRVHTCTHLPRAPFRSFFLTPLRHTHTHTHTHTDTLSHSLPHPPLRHPPPAKPTAGPAAGLQRPPACAQLSGCHEGPTNATSFPCVQQGAEVETAPELAAPQVQGARGLWLSEERQAGGPADSAPRFGTNALPVSVGAQRVRPGACTGQGGRIPRGHSSTQTSRDPGPHRGFIRHHFVSIQSRKKVMSLWGGVLGTAVCSAREPSPHHGGGTRAAGSRGRWHQGWHSVWPRAKTCRPAGATSSPWGVLPRVLRPRMCRGGKPSPGACFHPTRPLPPRPALRSRHPERSPGQSRPTMATKQGKKGQRFRGTAVRHGWHGRTPTHPGGGVLRATAAERVSETGEDPSGL